MLKFNGEKFKVMHVTDTQDMQFTSADMLAFLEAALKSEKPDLVVFTGDTVKGYAPALRMGNFSENTARTIRNTLTPLEKANVPFIYTFGNHDATPKCGREYQASVYESSPVCVCGDCFSRLNGTDCMCLPVYDENGEKPVFAVYMLDNCGRRDGHNGISEKQKKWITDTAAALREINGGNTVPVTAFQHIPLYAVYNILNEVPPKTKGAFPGNRTHEGKFYAMTDEMKNRGEELHEIVSCCSDDGEFETFKESGAVNGVFFGHDHMNSFTGVFERIKIGYTPGAGFGAYGNGTRRGVRVLEYTADGRFTDRVVTYESLLGKRLKRPVRYTFYKLAPSSKADAIKKGKKLAAAAGITTAAVVSIKLLKKEK